MRRENLPQGLTLSTDRHTDWMSVGLFLATALLATPVVFFALSSPRGLRLAVFAVLLGVLVTAVFLAPRLTLLTTLALIPLLGLLRRVLPSSGAAAGADPFVLIFPVLGLLLLCVRSARSDRRWSGVERALAVVVVGLAISIVNPFGGGIVAGVTQFSVVGLPLVWFWVASRQVRASGGTFDAMLRLTVAMGVVVCVYGRYQVLAGFTSWDQRWILEQGISSLDIGGFNRPFSTFTAPSDYGTFVGLSLASATSMAFDPKTRLVWRLLFSVTAVGFCVEIFLQGSRGILLFATIPVVLAIFVRLGLKMRFVIPLGVAGVSLLPSLLSGLAAKLGSANSTSQAATNRQLEGLSDPFSSTSTLPGHIDRLAEGVLRGFDFPVGYGVSNIGPGSPSTTAGLAGTETSFGDLGLSLGVFGLLAGVLFAVAMLAVIATFVQPRSDSSVWLIFLLGIIPFGPPLVGGNYASQVVFYALLGGALARVSKDPGRADLISECHEPWNSNSKLLASR